MNLKKNKIKAIFSDVDGTLTDGRLYISGDGEEFKVFDVKDGQGIKMWMDLDLFFGVITKRESTSLIYRMRELNVSIFKQNISDKTKWLSKWLKSNNLKWKNLAYIGDDINDKEVLKKCGFSACPKDAVKSVQKIVDYKCKNKGGRAAVREFIELIIKFN